MSIGLRIKKLRTALKVTQMGLANLLQVSQSSIATWELDKASPRPDILERIEKFCSRRRIKINWRK